MSRQLEKIAYLESRNEENKAQYVARLQVAQDEYETLFILAKTQEKLIQTLLKKIKELESK